MPARCCAYRPLRMVLVRPRLHQNDGIKEGEDAIRFLARQPATAHRIAERLTRLAREPLPLRTGLMLASPDFMRK